MAAGNLHYMAFLTKLVSGRVALWVTFWLIGIPLAIVWDVTGGCILVGCGMQSVGPRIDLFIARLLIALFTLSSVGVGLASVAIWRSASTHQRIKWWEGLLVFSAKLYAALTGTTAFVVLIAILYGLLHHGLTAMETSFVCTSLDARQVLLM